MIKSLLRLLAQPPACHHSSRSSSSHSSSSRSSRVLALHSLLKGARQHRPAVHWGPLMRLLLAALRLASLPQQRSTAGCLAMLLGIGTPQATRRLQRLLAPSPRRRSSFGPPQRQQPSSSEQPLMPARRQATPLGGLHGSGMASLALAAPGAPTPLQELPPAHQGPDPNRGWGRQLPCPWGIVTVMLHKPAGRVALSGPLASGACLRAAQMGSLPGAPARGGLAQHLPQVRCIKSKVVSG